MYRNQHKPNPPLDAELERWICHYWKARLSDKQILDMLKRKHIDTSRYGLGLTRFRAMRQSLGLVSTRTQSIQVGDLVLPMQRLREKYPLAGMRDMRNHLFHEEDLSVSRRQLYEYMKAYEPQLLQQRKARHLKRKRFWAAGVNDIWCCDQHDKWERFGLRLHTGVEPFSGRILWLKIWHNNSNPRLIAAYYFETVDSLGCMPLVTQSDLGSENYCLAKAHTALRHWHDPALAGSLQHRWMREKKNIKPEIAWSQVRRRFTPGFENMLDHGVQEGWYDIDDPLHKMVFRWVFIPWLQAELDRWRDEFNFSKPRADRNKILPHGVPQLIFESSEVYGAVDFKVYVA
ncbi:hypothetical protein CALVIDRAFT_480296 [Calocera viscosa TUFC12733]|uniref:Integrase core domain-containing protein n=1 Tax=Calocera viscosa (strain TUFC12733) TaxID=1330018 RepID=A0A167N532_CALVF|nr:hypothetical protein CALVIDRAFT_480296 [Calocera viscosa TUFC12733]